MPLVTQFKNVTFATTLGVAPGAVPFMSPRSERAAAAPAISARELARGLPRKASAALPGAVSASGAEILDFPVTAAATSERRSPRAQRAQSCSPRRLPLEPWDLRRRVRLLCISRPVLPRDSRRQNGAVFKRGLRVLLLPRAYTWGQMTSNDVAPTGAFASPRSHKLRYGITRNGTLLERVSPGATRVSLPACISHLRSDSRIQALTRLPVPVDTCNRAPTIHPVL